MQKEIECPSPTLRLVMNTRYGRDDRIRTCGLCVPNATLYQAEPHPVIFAWSRKTYNLIYDSTFHARFQDVLKIFLYLGISENIAPKKLS